MSRVPVAAIFDVGKTNKKLFLFTEQYEIVHESQAGFAEMEDEDGDLCDDLGKISSWIKSTMHEVLGMQEFEIRAVNFCSYGASFVHMDAHENVLTPLYNYLKKYPENLSREFYDLYGGASTFSVQTASPVLGSLNSGMQIYRIKKEKPEVFQKIRYSLHLPQYLSWLLGGKYFSDLTSIGCHTNLWNFAQNHYHEWVYREGIIDKLAPIVSSGHTENITIQNNKMAVGVGLHDSSAALIPYLKSFHEPFVLISTGTWCISLNPFNSKALSIAELQEDCLSYLSFQGNPIKASRIFAGYHHEQEIKRLAVHFQKALDYYKEVSYNAELKRALEDMQNPSMPVHLTTEQGYQQRDLTLHSNYEEAYHQLMLDIMHRQVQALHLILDNQDVKRIFVDGGFGQNPIYMHLLAESLKEIEVFAASVSQATSMGTALAIHPSWNKNPLPDDLIELKLYPVFF